MRAPVAIAPTTSMSSSTSPSALLGSPVGLFVAPSTDTAVTVGVVGKRRVSIAQGLKAGATVVLADLDAAVPSSTTNSNRPELRNGDIGGGPVTFTKP